MAMAPATTTRQPSQAALIILTQATQPSFNGERASAARWQALDLHYQHLMKAEARQSHATPPASSSCPSRAFPYGVRLVG
jgi:hypothetical protein